MRCTMRGENWPIASWTTTIVIVRTRAARLTIDVAMAERMVSAASGPPVNACGMSPWSKASSIQSVAKETATPASTQATGTNQRLERMWSPRRNRVNGRDCTGERTQQCVFSRVAPFRRRARCFERSRRGRLETTWNLPAFTSTAMATAKHP